MVNTEEFIKRLEILLEYYGISASVFAEEIDVQRSGLSHLLSGRNKPSLDFVMKVVERFPEVDLYWLLNGKGSFPKDKTGGEPASSSPPEPDNTLGSFDLFTKTEPAAKDVNQSLPAVNREAVMTGENIERIVVFYKDGTFRSFLPQ